MSLLPPFVLLASTLLQAPQAAVQVPAGNLSGCLETRDWSALESGSVEYKYYCTGTGLVLETDQAGGHRNELTGVTGP